MADALDFSQTQRIVLLIDLNPLLHLQNPTPYLTSILTSSHILLTFPSLSTSLFAFKLFFSSLSPLLSSSSLHRLLPKPSSPSLSFNHPTETLDSLSTTLNSLSNSPISAELDGSTSTSAPRASHLAGSLLQLVHDYVWESEGEDLSGTDNNFPIVRSNLIVLFSSICRSLNSLSQFMDLDVNDESLTSIDAFYDKFHDFFGVVKDAYVSRDIHFSWIDVNYQFDCNDEKSEIDESMLQLGFFESGIRKMGWGFSSTNSIILGSTVIPFGLIYPKFGILFKFLDFSDFCKSTVAQLNLEILDVGGKPLECKCCDLELLSMKMLTGLRSDDIIHTLEFGNSESEGFKQDDKFWNHFGGGMIKLDVKMVHSYSECEKFKGCSSDSFLLRGFSGEPGKITKKGCPSFFADRVLEILEMGKVTQRETLPVWQILLSFLYRKGYWALVSLSNCKGDSCMALIKPFTAQLALLSIIDYGHVSLHGLPCEDMNHSIDIGTSSPKNYAGLGVDKRKKNKRNLYQDLTWSSFHKAAYERSELDLEQVYFSKKFEKSKKLKFLKCWMKQIKNSSCNSPTMPNGSKLHHHISKERDERLVGMRKEHEKPMSSDSSTRQSKTEEDPTLFSLPETSAEFFSDLSKKIQQGLESDGVDLQMLAKRLVNLSIHWLYQKCEMDNSIEDQTLLVKSDETHGRIVPSELIKLLLREPKKLKKKSTDNDPSCPSDPRSSRSISDSIVREYELQILLRMEILHSEVGDSIEESLKKKFVKHICSLLEIIQYLLEGGFHGHVSLYDYVERTIKSRYSHTLGDVVKRIYARVDLLPFGDEIESPILLLNSEDSNHSWREKPDTDEMGEIKDVHQSISAEDSSQQKENNDESPQGIKKEEHARKVSEARKRREKARRHVSFTSWMPDLQRVWAPKQPKATRANSESLQKQLKKRERRKTSYDIVCETPLTRKRFSCSPGSGIGDDEHQDHGSNSSSSVSKALFQDHM